MTEYMSKDKYRYFVNKGNNEIAIVKENKDVIFVNPDFTLGIWTLDDKKKMTFDDLMTFDDFGKSNKGNSNKQVSPYLYIELPTYYVIERDNYFEKKGREYRYFVYRGNNNIIAIVKDNQYVVFVKPDFTGLGSWSLFDKNMNSNSNPTAQVIELPTDVKKWDNYFETIHIGGKTHTGKRGGKYIIKGGQKKYLKYGK